MTSESVEPEPYEPPRIEVRHALEPPLIGTDALISVVPPP
jgi:hypothetical protein